MRKGSATAPQLITIHVLREEKQKSTKSFQKCQIVLSFLFDAFLFRDFLQSQFEVTKFRQIDMKFCYVKLYCKQTLLFVMINYF